MKKILRKKRYVRKILGTQYPVISQWGVSHFGHQNGLDYVHDGFVSLMDRHAKYPRAFPKSLVKVLGLWRVLIQKAYDLRQKELRGMCSLDEAERLMLVTDSIEETRALINGIGRYLPLEGRNVLFHLYVRGESLRECSKALGLSRAKVESIQGKTIHYLGKLVRHDLDIINRAL